MACTHCGAQMAPAAKFCGGCGRAQSGNGSANAQPSTSLVIGTDPACDIVLRDVSVSRKHVRISLNSVTGGYTIEDLGSTNGTYVAGRRVQSAEAPRDAIIQLGQRAFELRRVGGRLGQTSIATGRAQVVGRTADADLVLPYPVVSSRHLEVRSNGGMLAVRDLGSSNGSFIDGRRLPENQWTPLLLGQSLSLGSFRVPPATLTDWTESLEEEAPESAARTERATIPDDGAILLGRSPECDVVIDDPQVSWEHARISGKAGRWTIADLGSSNGTFLNGSKIKRAALHPEDQLFLGNVSIDLAGGKVAAPARFKGEVRLDAIDLTRRLDNGKVILDGVGVSIYPGEMVALMGPSGAGKTTLLEILTGQRRPSGGEVLFNNLNLHDNRPNVAERIGYVPQEDVMHRDLTVYEVLYHSAVMRLPADLPRAAVEDHVNKLMMRMGIAQIRDSPIGDETTRGISGGQRKRVNIAIELITEPPLLFLDEPTSGLDSTSTMEVMNVLRDLSDSGKTIVMTIHQPRVEAFRVFDKLLLLAKGGKLAYFGPATPAGAYFSARSKLPMSDGVNPADYAIDVLDPTEPGFRRAPEDWQKDYRQSTEYKEHVLNRRGETDEVVIVPPKGERRSRRGLDAQFQNLFSRYLKRKLRDQASLGIQLAQPVIVGVLLGWLFAGDENGLEYFDPRVPLSARGVNATLFLLGATAFWLGCSNVARELVSERAVFRRERRAGLPVSAYLGAAFSLQVLLAAVQTFVLASLIWVMVDVQGETFFLSWLVLLATAALGIAVGLLVSALAKTEVFALSMVPILLLPQLMFAGYLQLYDLLDKGQAFLADLMPLRWSFELLAWLEYDAVFDGDRQLRDAIGFPLDEPLFGAYFLLFWTAGALLACRSSLYRLKD